MKVEPEIALVFSPETWVEGLHRHLTDHGGARVRQVVMDPTLALEEEYDALVVSNRWPSLTRAFIDAVHARRRRILGVFDPEEPSGRAHLLQLGIDRVIEADAPMTSFVDSLASLTLSMPAAPSDDDLKALVGEVAANVRVEGIRQPSLVAVSGPAGAGSTEVAIELANARAHHASVTLVDADDVAPAIAQRLGLAIEPNVRTAVDAVEYGNGILATSLLHAPGAPFEVFCGLPNAAAWSQVRPGEVLDVLAALDHAGRGVVADVAGLLEDLAVGVGRNRYGITRATLGVASVIVAVGAPTPVGVTRLVNWLADARGLGTEAAVHIVINRGPPDAFRRAEIADEIHRSYRPAGLWFLPEDRRVEAAAWAGHFVAPGPFTRAVGELAAVAMPVAGPPPVRRSRSGSVRTRRGIR
jgi:hypothetical protein